MNGLRTCDQADTLVDIVLALEAERGEGADTDTLFWAEATRRSIESHLRDLGDPVHSEESHLVRIEETVRAMALATEFGFLLDRDRKLLSIGYSVAEGALDPSCYDLLASEARLASFIAIAKATSRRATGSGWAAPLSPSCAAPR